MEFASRTISPEPDISLYARPGWPFAGELESCDGHGVVVRVNLRLPDASSSGTSGRAEVPGDNSIDVPATPTLPNANLRYQEALDWRKWTSSFRVPLFNLKLSAQF